MSVSINRRTALAALGAAGAAATWPARAQSGAVVVYTSNNAQAFEAVQETAKKRLPNVKWSAITGGSGLSKDEIDSYLASGEWRGKAGAYGIQGLAGTFVVKLVGSYSNVVGLPLYETVSLLTGEGFNVRLKWLSAGI